MEPWEESEEGGERIKEGKVEEGKEGKGKHVYRGCEGVWGRGRKVRNVGGERTQGEAKVEQVEEEEGR